MKKFIACLLTTAMLLSCMTPVFAEEAETGPGSITINNAVVGQTYSLYKMFDLESYDVKDPKNEKFSYRVCEEWKDFFKVDENGKKVGAGAEYITLDSNGYIASTSLNNTNAQAFSKAALAWAASNEDVNPCSVIPATEDNLPVVFKDLALGYYLVDSTLGTMCILETNIKDLTIEDKNTEATLSYKVQTDDGTFEDVHHTDIISTLFYKINVSAKPGAQKYKVYVNKADGINADINSIEVTIQRELSSQEQEQESPTILKPGTDYTLFESSLVPLNAEVQDSDYNFGIEFEQNVLDRILENALITITYKAETNESVSYTKIKEPNPNTSAAWMTYGESSTTGMDETRVYTYHLPIFKYTGDLENPTALSDAQFILYQGTEDETKYAQFDDEGKFIGWSGKKSEATTLTSGENGMIDLFGLSTGEYYLKETVAPDGYNKLIHAIPIQIGVDENQGAAYTQDSDWTEQINVLNNTGSQLPSTGGMGTKIFYALGATMFVSAVILLVVRKRMSK